jgi:hypothetical protein
VTASAIPAYAGDRHQVVLAGHGVDLRDALHVHELLRDFVDPRLLHHQKNDCTHHGITLLDENSIPGPEIS